MLLIPPPRLQERKLLLAKTNRRQKSDGNDRPGKENPFSSLRSSVASATEMVSSCQQSLPARDGEVRPPPGATPVPEPPVKPGQAIQGDPRIAATTATHAHAAASARAPSAGHNRMMAALPKTPRQYHLASPGPPPNRALPPTPRDAQRSALASPIPRQGQAGSSRVATPANASQVACSSRKPSGALESTAERAPTSPPGPAGTGTDTSVTASSPVPKEGVNSLVLGEDELERLGGSYK
ncbi:hypothetical protein OCS_01357 [Ophiocordyceps sinensis CO18]|nr:hypothetical protein OCS_01357 [Ophiocordyceps sinensis CO18]